jgi:hypothetical protein
MIAHHSEFPATSIVDLSVLSKTFSTLGPQRSFLAVISVGLMVAAPFAFEEASYLDWAIVPTVIAPIVLVMMLFVLPLDMIMTRVFLSDPGSEEERARLKRVLVIEGSLFLAVAVAWMPFLNSMLPD